MTFFHSIILGVVEGLTEFLPISSTAHLILVSKFLHLPSSEFLKSFEIAIQLGAIASVVFLYFKTFLKNWNLNMKLITAFIPMAVIGLMLYKFVKSYLLVNPLVSIYALLIGGILIVIFELIYKERGGYTGGLNSISFKQSLLIGCAQAVSIIPGVSRAAATILGGMALGIKRKTIVEFSFLLAVPTMLAATGLDLIKNSSSFSSSEWKLMVVGFVVSFIVALAVIKFLLNYVKTKKFTPFGVYRIIVAIIFWFLLI